MLSSMGSSGRVDNRIAGATRSRPYLGTWPGRSDWCNRPQTCGRFVLLPEIGASAILDGGAMSTQPRDATLGGVTLVTAATEPAQEPQQTQETVVRIGWKVDREYPQLQRVRHTVTSGGRVEAEVRYVVLPLRAQPGG